VTIENYRSVTEKLQFHLHSHYTAHVVS